MHINSIPAIPFRPTHDSTGMNHIEDHHNRKHEQSVKHVKVSFVVEQHAVTPLQILHHPENRPHHDEGTGSIQSPHVLFPGVRAARLDRWDEDQFAVEADGEHHEEAEEGELDEEADYDDVGSHF
jgi:hypothetical protein